MISNFGNTLTEIRNHTSEIKNTEGPLFTPQRNQRRPHHIAFVPRTVFYMDIEKQTVHRFVLRRIAGRQAASCVNE